MNYELLSLLDKTKSHNNEGYPLMITLGSPGPIWIDLNKLTQFFKGYCNLSNIGKNDLGLAEVIDTTASPLVIEGTLKYNVNVSGELITEEFIRTLIHYYQQAIIKHLKISEDQHELLCVYLESPTYHTNIKNVDITADNTVTFRLHFPYCCVDSKIHKIIQPVVIANLMEFNSAHLLMSQPIGEWENILKPVIKYLTLYGSRNNSTTPWLEFQRIYEKVDPDDENNIEAEICDLDRAYSPKLHSYTSKRLLHESEINDDRLFWLPLFLSIHFYEKISLGVGDSKSTNNIEMRLPTDSNSAEEIKDHDYPAMADQLVSLLSANRIRNTSDFQDIGRALYSIHQGGEKGLDIWIRLAERHGQLRKAAKIPKSIPKPSAKRQKIIEVDSDSDVLPDSVMKSPLSSPERNSAASSPRAGAKRKATIPFADDVIDDPKEAEILLSPKILADGFTKDEMTSMYYSFEGNHNTIRTLGWMVRVDTPDAYTRWHRDWCRPSFESAAAATDATLARALYRFYWLDFTCSSPDLKSWYRFKDHRWQHIERAYAINTLISTDFSDQFDLYRHELGARKLNNRDNDVKASLETKIKNMTALPFKLQKRAFKQTMLEEAAGLFYELDLNFRKYRDSDPRLMGFKNCVLEIDDLAGKAIIRDGRPDDLITMTTGGSFKRNQRHDSPGMKRWLNWLEQLIPDPKLRHEFSKWLASCLRGVNLDKKVSIWTGKTNAGKTTLASAVKKAFGEYATNLKPGAACEKDPASNAANPDLAAVRGAKVVFIEELHKGRDRISAAFIKRFTGRDDIKSRALYENGGTFPNLSKLVFIFNEIPEIDEPDEATKARFLGFPFLSVWSKDAPESIDEQKQKRIFKADKYFDNHLGEIADALMCYLVQYYPIYAREGLEELEAIKDVAKTYWKGIDFYQNFVDEYFIRVPDDNKKRLTFGVSSMEAYLAYKDWIKVKFPRKNMDDAYKFSTIMIEKLGPQTGKQWLGWTLKTAED